MRQVVGTCEETVHGKGKTTGEISENKQGMGAAIVRCRANPKESGRLRQPEKNL
jgi:hypothetical protein